LIEAIAIGLVRRFSMYNVRTWAAVLALTMAAAITLSACNENSPEGAGQASDQNNAERTNEAEPIGVGGTTNQ
jgi:predicted small secreted protein